MSQPETAVDATDDAATLNKDEDNSSVVGHGDGLNVNIESPASIHSDSTNGMAKTSLKRAYSFPGSDGIEVIEKRTKSDSELTVDADAGTDFNVEDSLEPEQTDTLPAASSDAAEVEPIHDDSADRVDTAFPQSHMAGGNVPYNPWAYDPRFAMMLRSDFMHTYQNFLDVFNASKTRTFSENGKQ